MPLVGVKCIRDALEFGACDCAAKNRTHARCKYTHKHTQFIPLFSAAPTEERGVCAVYFDRWQKRCVQFYKTAPLLFFSKLRMCFLKKKLFSILPPFFNFNTITSIYIMLSKVLFFKEKYRFVNAATLLCTQKWEKRLPPCMCVCVCVCVRARVRQQIPSLPHRERDAPKPRAHQACKSAKPQWPSCTLRGRPAPAPSQF